MPYVGRKRGSIMRIDSALELTGMATLPDVDWYAKKTEKKGSDQSVYVYRKDNDEPYGNRHFCGIPGMLKTTWHPYSMGRRFVGHTPLSDALDALRFGMSFGQVTGPYGAFVKLDLDDIFQGAPLTKSSPFYIVWNPNSLKPPTMKHWHESKANKAATRLAEKKPGEDFFVLKVVRKYHTSKPLIGMEEFK